MKKNMLLLVALLVVSGITFGQKEAKLLWQTQDKFSSSNPHLSLGITPTGKTIVTVLNGFTGSKENIRVYDEKGAELNSLSGKPLFISELGKKISLASTKDSLYFLDKEFSFVGTIKNNMSGTSLLEVEDGFIFYSEKDVFKYNFKGDKLWQYTSDEKIDQIASKSIPLFKLLGGNYLLLSSNGEKQKNIVPIIANQTWIFDTKDQGFWLTDLQRFIKYDSTGKQTGLADFKKDSLNYAPPFPLTLYYDWKVTPDNSMIVFHAKKGEIYFTKIDTEGKTKTIRRKVNGLSEVLYSARISIINNNKFTFNITPAGDPSNNKGIGMGDFTDSNLGWTKESLTIDEEASAIDNYGNNDIFRTFEYTIDANTGYRKKSKLLYYYIDGKLTFSFTNDKIDFVKNTKDYIYIGHDSFVSKYQLNNGQLIWKKDNPVGSKYNEPQFINDPEGNDYWIYSKSYGVETKIDFISKKNNQTSRFFTYPKNYNAVHANFLIDFKSRTLITATNSEDNNSNHILRKYSTRCLYDLEATAEATGKTEVCSGSKVKLSTTEQDGLTYQWQKDGKDIPTFKDIVYNVEESGNYTVKVEDENCQSQTTSNPIKVTVKSLPEANISTDIKGVIYEPFTVKMSANSGTGLSYQWMKDDIAIPNETGNTYEAKKSGKYNLSVTKEGCVKISDALTISILIPLANQEEVGEEQVQIYPNPSNGNFKIILPKLLKGSDTQLLDSFGRQRSLIYTGEQAQAEGLGKGVYFLKVSKGEKVVTSKLIIE